MTVKTFWIISVVIGVVVLAIVFVVKPNILIALGAAFAAAFGLPRWVLSFLGKKRTKKFTEAFSDAIDIIVRGIKSGLPVHDCLKIIGREAPQEIFPIVARWLDAHRPGYESLGETAATTAASEK